MKKLILFVICVLAGGCASLVSAMLPHTNIIDLPVLNEVRTAEIGDTIVSRIVVNEYDAIILKEKITSGDGVIRGWVTIMPGKLIAKTQDETYKYYYSDSITFYGMKSQGGIRISKNDPDVMDVFSDQSLFKYRKLKKKPEIEYIKERDVKGPSFEQTLIYNGRVENNVKFLYREFREKMMRFPFSQEVQYDLNEGNIIGFKSARIEIIEATNTELKYKVLKHFPDND